jgi:hypothetical protein
MEALMGNGLTAAEIERLTLLQEGCAEVIAAICKIKRHGWDGASAIVPDSLTNRQMLEKKFGDVCVAAELMLQEKDYRNFACMAAADEKRAVDNRWLYHNQIKTRRG